LRGGGKDDSEKAREEVTNIKKRMDTAEMKIKSLTDSLAKARKANELLLSMRAEQDREIKALKMASSGGKRGRPARDRCEPEFAFDAVESWEDM
jgi:chromosome segregation ATPase